MHFPKQTPKSAFVEQEQPACCCVSLWSHDIKTKKNQGCYASEHWEMCGLL